MANKNFSLFEQLEINLKAIHDIDNCIKITLGPSGKSVLFLDPKENIQFLNSGSILLKSLNFPAESANIIRKLLEQAATKTYNISGDGSTTTILFSCELLKNSLRFLSNGYNSVFLSNGLKKIAYFLISKVLEFSVPISSNNQLIGILKTSLGKKINTDLYELLQQSILTIGRDGLVLIEENISDKNELEVVQGIELEKGFASSYFINDVKNFEVVYEKPYVLITTTPLTSLNQIREIIDHIKLTNRPLVLVVEEINKEILSTLVLNNIQKKFKIVVIKYKTIKFVKTGLLEDLSLLTYSNSLNTDIESSTNVFKIENLGQAEKVIVKKEKSTFIISKFSKLLAKRRINELNRELLNSESEHEKNIFKTRIARLSGNITKIKIGISNKYEMEEQKQKINSLISTLKSALEEGIIPGGGAFYFHLQEELSSWASLNLIGEEVFSSQIVLKALQRPLYELLENTNAPRFSVSEKLLFLKYPFSYNVITKEIVNSFEEGIVDSSKSVRAVLWNSISIISTLITSE